MQSVKHCRIIAPVFKLTSSSVSVLSPAHPCVSIEGGETRRVRQAARQRGVTGGRGASYWLC